MTNLEAMQLWDEDEGAPQGPVLPIPVEPILPLHRRVESALDAMDVVSQEGGLQDDDVVADDHLPSQSACDKVAEFWALQRGARLLDVQRESGSLPSNRALMQRSSTLE